MLLTPGTLSWSGQNIDPRGKFPLELLVVLLAKSTIFWYRGIAENIKYCKDTTHHVNLYWDMHQEKTVGKTEYE